MRRKDRRWSSPRPRPGSSSSRTNEQLRRPHMFWKTLVAVILTVAAAVVSRSVTVSIAVFVIAMIVVFIFEGVRIVPQQNAWVVERLGKYSRTLEPGLQLIVPFVDRIAYRHSLKEVPLDKTFESRDEINHTVVQVLDEAGRTWGIKVLRYEIKSLTPPESILRAMQAQITAEREKRAVIATSEGKRQQEINLADGERQAAILESEGQKQAQINKAAGEAGAIELVANANANAVRVVAQAMETQGGMSAANLKIAEKYIEAFGHLAKVNNTLIIPSNLGDVAGLIASAMTVLDRTKLGEAAAKK